MAHLNRLTICIVCLGIWLSAPVWAQSSQPKMAKAMAQGHLPAEGPGGVFTIRSPSEWQTFQRERGLTWAIDITFQTEMVVAVFLGTRSNAAHRVEIAEIRTHPHHTEVTYREIPPPVDQMAAQVIVNPYVIAVLDQTQTPVVFANDFFGPIEMPHGEYTRMITSISETHYQLDDMRRQKRQADARIRDLTGLLTTQ